MVQMVRVYYIFCFLLAIYEIVHVLSAESETRNYQSSESQDRAQTQKYASIDQNGDEVKTHTVPETYQNVVENHRIGSELRQNGRTAQQDHNEVKSHELESETSQRGFPTKKRKSDDIEEEFADSENNGKDESVVLDRAFHLEGGLPWKEETYTHDWLFSSKHPVLTGEVRWFCPFHFFDRPENTEDMRKRGKDEECTTVAEIKYWHKSSGVDVLLDSYQVSYIPSYVLTPSNVLKFIASDEVTENKVVMHVTFRYHSENPICKRITYEMIEGGREIQTTVEEGKCKPSTTDEWIWEADNEKEDEDWKNKNKAQMKTKVEDKETVRDKEEEQNAGKQDEGNKDDSLKEKQTHSERDVVNDGYNSPKRETVANHIDNNIPHSEIVGANYEHNNPNSEKAVSYDERANSHSEMNGA